MTGRMRISPAGIELIKSFEGFREIAVRLPDGRWTIGYGHVRTAREGLTITPKDAEELLKHDLRPVEQALGSLIYAPLMQGQFDARDIDGDQREDAEDSEPHRTCRHVGEHAFGTIDRHWSVFCHSDKDRGTSGAP